jgi:uncharacterized protein (TIGR04255 family)
VYSQSVIDLPFGPPVVEVPLPNAPLALVVAQVRFPIDLRIDEESTIRRVQEELRDRYPVLRQDHEMRIDFTPQGPKPVMQPIWRLGTSDATSWTISLARHFVSVSTQKYTSRADFLSRLRGTLESLQGSLQPPLADRLGVRYICRVDDASILGRLPTLLRQEVLGGLAVELGDAVTRQRQLLDAVYRHPEGASLQARWGLIDPGVTYDITLPPSLTSSTSAFVLDIDVATLSPQPFSAGDLVDLSRRFAERQYRFFRWAVTDDFLREFGAQI